MAKYSYPIEKYIGEMIFYHLCRVHDEAATRIKINAYLNMKNLRPISPAEFNTRVRAARSLYDRVDKQKDAPENEKI